MLYMGTSTGATLHLHYCNGKLVETNLWHPKTGECGKCGKAKQPTKACKKKCCKDEHKLVQVEKDQLKSPATAFETLQFLSNAVPASIIELPQIYASSLATENPRSHAPPRSAKVPITILHSCFLI